MRFLHNQTRNTPLPNVNVPQHLNQNIRIRARSVNLHNKFRLRRRTRPIFKRFRINISGHRPVTNYGNNTTVTRHTSRRSQLRRRLHTRLPNGLQTIVIKTIVSRGRLTLSANHRHDFSHNRRNTTGIPNFIMRQSGGTSPVRTLTPIDNTYSTLEHGALIDTDVVRACF